MKKQEMLEGKRWRSQPTTSAADAAGRRFSINPSGALNPHALRFFHSQRLVSDSAELFKFIESEH